MDKKIKAGFTGFIPWTATMEERMEALKYYGELGFEGFEGGGFLLKSDKFEEDLAKVKSYGLTPVDYSFMNAPEANTEASAQAIKDAHRLGVTRTVIYNNLASAWRFGGRPDPASYDEVMVEIEKTEALAKEFKKEGIDVMYHNHDVEFKVCYRGVPQLQFIAANTELLTFELDCGWAHSAGYDPAKLIHQLKNRISVLHVKDYQKMTVNYPNFKDVMVPQFTALGSGEVNLKETLVAGIEENIEWAVVEQDFQHTLTPKQALTAAYYNMKETGCIE